VNVIENDLVYLVSDYCAHGEAFDFVNALAPERKNDDKFTRGFFLQILDGVEHLHKHGIVHRDLKLDNVFLDGNVIPRVADLGFSKIFAGP